MSGVLSTNELQRFIEQSPFTRFCGIELASVDPGSRQLVMRMPFKPALERSEGTGQFHGGPIAALIDTAACFAVVMLIGRGAPTINFRTDYLRPAVNTALTATATVRRIGKTVSIADVDVTNELGELVAIGRGTFGTAEAT